jgi:RIO-like serine/threonine protein kinase
MILIKENKDKTRAVYKLADGRYRKVWKSSDEKALSHHIELLNKFMPHWVIDSGTTTESMYIDTLPISGKCADTIEPTQEFIDKIYEFCLGNINTTFPYAHGDWSLSNIILTGDDVSIVDWDNIAISKPADVIAKLHSDLTLAFGDKFTLPTEFTVPEEVKEITE